MIAKLLRSATLALAVLASVGNGASVALQPRQGADTPWTNSSIAVKSLGSLSLTLPGFAKVISQGGKNTLFVSSFGLLTEFVSRINNIDTLPSVGLSALKATTVGGSVVWPNDLTVAPAEVFGTEGVVVGGGFLVPFHTNGGIWYSANANSASGSWVPLITKSGWWYHRVVFADMDGDGKLDIVSCRATVPLLGATQTMLVVLKPKSATAPTGTWVETEIGAGCDALFQVEDLDGDGIPEVIAPSYFTNTLNLFHSTASTGFSNAANVKKIVIDSNVGAAFDVEYVDINADGKKDLLITNHQGDGTGAVYAYEIPTNITNPSAYTRHTLSSGYPVTQWGLNQAAPGSAWTFYPTPQKTGAPYIAVAGDAAQKAYVLVPTGTAWTCKTTLLHNCGCTVGALGVADVDGDGYTEIIVPCYDNNKLEAYTFKP